MPPRPLSAHVVNGIADLDIPEVVDVELVSFARSLPTDDPDRR